MLDHRYAGRSVERLCPWPQDLPASQRPSIVLRVPTLLDRHRFEARLEACGVAMVWVDDLVRARLDAIERLPGIDAAARDAFRTLLDEVAGREEAMQALPLDATAERDAAGPSQTQKAQVTRLERMLRAADPYYAELHESRELRGRLHQSLSAQALLLDWQRMQDHGGRPLPFLRDGECVAESCLMRLSRLHLGWIANTAAALFWPSEEQAKNSDSPSGGTDGVTNSAAPTAAAAGASATPAITTVH